MKRILIAAGMCIAVLLAAIPALIVPAVEHPDTVTETNSGLSKNVQYTSEKVSNTSDKGLNIPKECDTDVTPSVTLSVGSKSYQAILYDNAASRELMERLPMEFEMEELHGNEKYYYLTEPLPTDTESVGTIRTGDIMLFGSDCLVLFYEDFKTTYNYTRIGRLENIGGLSDALGTGSVSVTFERNKE